MQDIQLIALDCDGTLINDQGHITERTQQALITAQKQGIKVALVSGRPRTGFHYETEELQLHQHHGLIGAYNGGLVLDVTTGETRFKKGIDLAEAREFLTAIQDLNLTYIVDHDGKLYTNTPDNQYVQHESRAHRLELIYEPKLHEIIDFHPVKILLTQDPDYIDGIATEIQGFCGDTLHTIRSTPFYLEITANGVNKSNALDHICQAIGIRKQNVIAFGDQLNDMEMLNDAGIGVAMGNATQEIKDIADIITDDNNHDGIAVVVEQILDARMR
ncbi:HAD family phosphatase [Staphylococcus muscae]|uniref:HAD superfamily hydrolase n=1 Tax=Staphylococcus muscae TaxID=1294 RepID=A0A240BTN6_9STAP|nr:Cof-type HAD-IIB family hydrolase [Staphylococcus muscae]AVQ34008.1 HAD family phosphatase [Staphylococcus muscae]PNZ04499.1 HAD family phosphatase [Staphylococcus muscae]GGA82506.1 haloacid dehalogenase [Staphylococcus muscae]SNV98286.1 HAD superfamily hydrolase [Staphylococcus muscae]